MNEFARESGQFAQEASKYLDSLLRADRSSANQIINQLIAEGIDIKDIYLQIFQSSQREIGRLWQANRINVAQEHYCTGATQLIMSQIYPSISRQPKIGRRLVATCINGERHEMGIRMVADFFELEGWNSYYLGSNSYLSASTQVNKILEYISYYEAEILGISATLHSNIQAVSELIGEIRKSADTSKLKIIVGGYPFNIAQDLWWKVGADMGAQDAREAVEKGTRAFMPFSPRPATLVQKHLISVSKETLMEFRKEVPEIIREAVRQSMTCKNDIVQHGDQAESILTAGFEFTVRMLDAAMYAGESSILEDQLKWASERLPHDGVSMAQVLTRFRILRSIVLSRLSKKGGKEVARYIDWMNARIELLMEPR
jgi:methanogenic corrinoid protein MtbC1